MLMKKPLIYCLAILLIIATLTGCGPADPAPTPGATTVTTQPTTGPVRDEAYYLNTVYAAQIQNQLLIHIKPEIIISGKLKDDIMAPVINTVRSLGKAGR